MSEAFGTLNWSILVGYIVANLLLGFVLSKRITSSNDFYLGQRTTPWWAIGISVIATYVSAMTFLGAPAWAYDEGLSVIALHLNYPLVIMAVIILFFPFFYNSGVASIYEYQEKRFGTKARGLIAGIWTLSQIMSSAAILYATSLVLSFITGVSVIWAIVIVTIIALIYTILGGITAVIWTDVIQSAILFIGAGIIFVTLLNTTETPFMETLASLSADGKTKALLWDFDLSAETTVYSGIIAMTLYHVTVYGTNQMMVQRTLAAKNIGDAKKSYLLMGFCAFFIYFFFIVLGVLFYSFYEGRTFDNPNTIILEFAQDYGTPGLMGIIAAAVMAASMSSLDSAFNSLSTVSVVDFYKKYLVKQATDDHYLLISRVFTVIFSVLIVIPAIGYHLYSEGSILEILSKVGSYFVGAQMGMFFVGFFSKHATERGLLIGTLCGFVSVMLAATFTDIAWPWYCLIGAASNIIVTEIASIALDGKQQAYSQYTVVGQQRHFTAQNLDEKENGWYRVPGKIDPVNYWLFGFFALTILFLLTIDLLI